MSLGSLRRSVRRPAWVAVLASLAVVFVAVLGPFWVKQARAGGLSGQDYTSFVITGGGGALAAYDAENPGAPEVTIPAPAGADFNAVAIDPTAAQVLVTVTPGTANPAEVMAFSTSGAALGALPVSLSDPGPIAISGSGSVGVGDLEGPSFVQLSVHQNGPPSLVGSGPTTLPDLTSGRTVLVASVCALAYSPSGKQLYVGADYQFVSEVPTTPCEPGPRSITELRDYGPGGLQGSVLVPVAGGGTSDFSGSIAALQVAPDDSAVYVAVHWAQDFSNGVVVKVTGLGGNAPAASVIAPPALANWNDFSGLAMSPDGNTLYVAANELGGPTNSAAVIPISTATGVAGSTVSLPNTLVTGVAVTPDDGQVLATSQAGLSAIGIPFGVPTATPNVSASGADALAITPDQAPVASLVFSPATPETGTSVTFDAAGSTVAYGQIASYAWNFGDGNTVTGNLHSVTHTYAAPGSYLVTLTETDNAGTSIPPAFASFPVDYTGQTALRRADPSAQTAVTVTVTNPPATTPPPTSPGGTPPTSPGGTPPTSPGGTTPTSPGSTPPSTGGHPTTGTTRPPTNNGHPKKPPNHGGGTTGIHSTGTTLPTTTTTTLPPPGSPTLTVNPGLGPPGQVVAFSGKNFPVLTRIAVQWSPGIGSVVVTSTAAGTIRGSILVLYRDLTGPRDLDAVGYPTAVAPYLVVPGPEEPAGTSSQFLFRR